MDTSAGGTPVELGDLLVNPSVAEAILVILFSLKPHGRPQLMSASGLSELWSGDRLLARLGPPKKSGSWFSHSMFLLFLIRNDG